LAKDPLSREYGVLLGITGPILLERIDSYVRIAEILEAQGCRDSAGYMRMQAQRLEEVIVSLGKGLENAR